MLILYRGDEHFDFTYDKLEVLHNTNDVMPF